MTVGETLTEARQQAGLSVAELSERTRIRETVIRSIEQDDYEACGGDLYARGYVRAIAGAVGIDAQPLIREYDLARADVPDDRANGSSWRHAKGSPRVAPDSAPTAFDLPAVTDPPAENDEPQQPADLNTTRFDLPAASENPAVTSYDLPRVPEVPPTTEFPAVMPPAVVLPASVPPPAAQPPGTADTRYDLPPVSDDLMAAGYDLGPTAEPAAADSADSADSATSIMPALDITAADSQATTAWSAPGQGGAGPVGPGQVGPGQVGPGQVGPGQVGPGQVGPGQVGPGQVGPGRIGAGQARAGRKKRGALFAAAAAAVLVVAGVLGVTLATGSTATKNTASSSVPDAAASSAAKASAAAQASASAAAEASAAAQASASAAAAKASQAAAAKAAAQRVTTLAIASVMAYGPNGFADGDNPGNARNAIARNPSAPWQTQWYTTPEFGMLKHGTGLLLDLGGKVTVTSVRLDLAPYQGTSLQIRVGNGTASSNLQVAATASDVGGMVKLTLRHPTAARYLLIWITQLPPDGAGHYREAISHISVVGRR